MTTNRFKDYLFSTSSLWFWITLILLGLSIIIVGIVPKEESSLTPARYVLSFVFILFIPGYCLIEAMFPAKDSLDIVERFALSIALSFTITALTGLLLNFTPFGINSVSVLTTLSIITFLLTVVALIRKYRSITGTLDTSFTAQD
jgi:uncharacterized membrane protein